MKLSDLAEMVKTQVEFIIKEAEKQNQINEQWFLNFLDSVNKLSVKY